MVRGSDTGLDIRGPLADKLLDQGYRWSAHTHPGLSDRVLMASGIPGDRQVLQLFNQDRSLILNSVGRRSTFDMENDYLITPQSIVASSYTPPRLGF